MPEKGGRRHARTTEPVRPGTHDRARTNRAIAERAPSLSAFFRRLAIGSQHVEEWDEVLDGDDGANGTGSGGGSGGSSGGSIHSGTSSNLSGIAGSGGAHADVARSAFRLDVGGQGEGSAKARSAARRPSSTSESTSSGAAAERVRGLLSREEERCLKAAPCPTTWCTSRIFRTTTTRLHAGGMSAPSPMVARAVQDLSSALEAFNSATKMKEVPVPFAYVQVPAHSSAARRPSHLSLYRARVTSRCRAPPNWLDTVHGALSPAPAHRKPPPPPLPIRHPLSRT